MPHETDHDATDDVIRVRALVAKARHQEGIDQVWSLLVASEVLREHDQAPRERLDRIDGHLRTCLERYGHGDAPGLSPEIIETLADLTQHAGQGDGRLGEGP